MAPTPKPVKITKEAGKAVKGGAKKKVTAKGYKKPEPIPNGEILTDLTKQNWKVGPSIGSGGFGEIYSACKVGESSKEYAYVVKIEPHGNGPLFVEMNFYLRNAKLADIEKFKKQRKLKTLGMPHFVGNGSHDLNGIKHRFVVMPRYGRDIWSYFLENGKKLPLETIYRIAIQMLDVLEYIHECTYVHADLKGANILLGLGKAGADQAYLVDFGLASHYIMKDFKPDPKKMHNGTIEYTSRDAHNGVPTMRGDLEILAFNVVHWSGITLPWEAEKLLQNPKKVQESKETFMSDLNTSLKKYYSGCPDVIANYLKYVATIKYDEVPDYNKCRKMFEAALKQLGVANSGELKFNIVSTAKASTSKLQAKRKAAVEMFSDSDDEASANMSISPAKKPSSRRKMDDSSSSNNVTDKRTKSVSKNVSIDTPGTVVVKSDFTSKTKKSKTYNINLELDLSIDANVMINVKRKPKKGKVESNPKRSNSKNDDSDEDDDVIPSSNGNTPKRAKVNLTKSKETPKKTSRKSPRSRL